MNKLLIVLLVNYSTLCCATDTHFEDAKLHASGAANIAYPNGGTFVYENKHDHRKPSIPVMLGKPKNKEYELFTSEEEKALSDMLDKQKAQKLLEQQKMMRQRSAQQFKNIDWPKIVRKTNQICVPQINSENGNWLENLTCLEDK